MIDKHVMVVMLASLGSFQAQQSCVSPQTGSRLRLKYFLASLTQYLHCRQTLKPSCCTSTGLIVELEGAFKDIVKGHVRSFL